MMPTKICLDSNWKFHLGDIPVESAGHVREPQVTVRQTYMHAKTGAGMGSPFLLDLDDKEWKMVDLPHDWVIAGRCTPDTNISQGFLPRGIGWYRKRFALPPESRDQKIYLEFEGVGRNSTVWVNGVRVGNHPSGYTSFAYDISDYVLTDAENMLAIKVDGTEMEGWWYEGCGIYRHVWLITKNRLHFDRWDVFISTPEISADHALVKMETAVWNEDEENCKFEITAEIFDADGSLAIKTSSFQTLGPRESQKFTQKMTLINPRLWSPDTPNLYRVRTQLRRETEVLDSEEYMIGVRRLEFTPNKGFFLNGHPLKIKGTCNHQDFAGVGVALTDRLHYKKIELLKEMGCNAYRCAHHPPAPALLDACDRIGMLVMDENRKLDGSEEGIADLRSMVRRDRNHPSIIIWSLENEETLEGTEVGARILKRLYRITKEEDPTRDVTAAISHDWNQCGYADILDVVGYNYFPEKYLEEHKNYPTRKMLASEIGSVEETRGIYESVNGYCNSCHNPPPPETTPGHEISWRAVAENEFMAGCFIWTGFAYRGEPVPYEWPNTSSQKGIIDLCGFPKDAYYYYLAAWTDKPMVHIFPHWNWPGREGREIPVWCYSNCDQVELLLNNKSLGKKDVIRNSHLEWPVVYKPGELKARGYRAGQEVCVKSVKTAGVPDRINFSADRQTLAADGCDVACVKISVLDKNGILVPTADNTIAFRVENNGKLLGMGNGDPKNHCCDKETSYSVFNGLCLAILQSGSEPGILKFTATSAGLFSAELEIKVT